MRGMSGAMCCLSLTNNILINLFCCNGPSLGTLQKTLTQLNNSDTNFLSLMDSLSNHLIYSLS